MTIEAMKQALDALCDFDYDKRQSAIAALRAAIEQAQDPVAWMTHSNDMIPLFHKTRAAALNWQTQPTPLYTAPRQWQGLTDEEIKEIIGPWGETPIKGYTRKLFDQIEAKLKEKNG